MGEETYQSVRSRLDEILEEVNKEGVSLDDALALYEEAVKLSLSACDLSESDLALRDDAQEAAEGESVDVSVDVPLSAPAAEAGSVPPDVNGSVSNISE